MYKITVVYCADDPTPFTASLYSTETGEEWALEWTRRFETWWQIDKAAAEFMAQ